MKILITGMNVKHVGGRQLRPYLSNSELPALALRQRGHHVEQRHVVPGEDIGDYDKVVVYLAPLDAMNATYKYGALWALHERPDAVTAINDWQIRQSYNSFKNPAVIGRLFKAADNARSKGGPKCIKEHREALAGKAGAKLRDKLAGVVQDWVDAGRLTRKIALPKFSWGDGKLIPIKADEVAFYDPTPFVDLSACSAAYDAHRGRRRREWVYATLTARPSAGRKLGFFDKEGNKVCSWEVARFGPGGKAHLPEDELHAAAARAIGRAVFPHDHAGSGWWRASWVWAMLDEWQIATVDPRDGKAFDPGGWLSTAQIEELDDDGLREYRRRQSRRFWAGVADAKTARAAVAEAFL